jgi:protein-disulfide isomerase
VLASAGVSTPSRKERREHARAERRACEAAEAARAQRNRRLRQLGALLAAAAAVVVVAIVISSSRGPGTSTKAPAGGQPASGIAATNALLRGIPQKGNTLGDRKAPVTLQEFADLQCPICQAYTLDSMPTLIQRYVRTGKVRMVFRNLPILGPDSQRAAQVAAGAAQRNRLWSFADLFYRNQGAEDTGYVTPPFLAKIARGAGVDTEHAVAQPPAEAARAQLAADQSLADRYALNATPSFLLGKTGGTASPLSQPDVTDPSSFTGPIDSLLGT